MLVPFIVSLVLIIAILLLIVQVKKRYKDEVEAAHLKYNTNDFEM